MNLGKTLPPNLAQGLLYWMRMYPPTSLELSHARSEVETIRDALRGAILTLEVEKSSVADPRQDFEADLQAILGLGVLLNDLQNRRLCLEKIGGILPSPNQVGEAEADDVAGLGHLVFDTIGHVKNIQQETYRLARLNLKAACHKMKAVRKYAKR